MTPLELLAVGVIVVLVWSAGWISRDNSDNKDSAVTWVPLVLGLLAFVVAISWILALGIKEAAK